MTPRRSIQPCWHDESGLSLPATLITLAVGLILIVPLLTSTSTAMLGTRAADQALLRHYSLDAGIEYGIWKLRYDAAFRATVDAVPLTPVAVTPSMSLNGVSPSLTATALNTSGWTTLAQTPTNAIAGAALAYGGGDYLFAMRGSNRDFWRYGMSGDTWALRADSPADTGQGAALAWDGGSFVYAFRGGNNTAFWRYSIPGNTWTVLAPAPASVRNGGSLAYSGGYVYGLRGDNSQDFWRYSVAGDSWASRADTPADVNGGGALVYAGSNVFYALRGDNTTAFWRYNSVSDGWTVLAMIPAAPDHGGALS